MDQQEKKGESKPNESLTIDNWQMNPPPYEQRVKYLLEFQKWSDCSFLVGNEEPIKKFNCHKLILAMSSSVFDAMFYGQLAEIDDPIKVPDIQPCVFKALLEYIYKDKINLNSFDEACEIYYAANKYMLQDFKKQILQFLIQNLSVKNINKAYEFLKLYDSDDLKEKMDKFISSNTIDVLTDQSIENVELEILLYITKLDNLNIDTELDLFNALQLYLKLHNGGSTYPGSNESAFRDKENNNEIVWRDVLKNIRFLTLTPQQFVEGPAKSNLMKKREVHDILMNICSINCDFPMPEGFSKSKCHRNMIKNPFIELLYCIKENEDKTKILSHHIPIPPYAEYTQHQTVNATRNENCPQKEFCQPTCLDESEQNIFLNNVLFSKNILISHLKIPYQIFNIQNTQYHRLNSKITSENLSVMFSFYNSHSNYFSINDLNPDENRRGCYIHISFLKNPIQFHSNERFNIKLTLKRKYKQCDCKKYLTT